MPRTRVLVTELPGLLRGMVRELVDVDETIEVKEAASLSEALRVMEESPVDVVVLGLPESRLAEAGERLFSRNGDLRILGVTNDGRGAYLYELRPALTRLGEPSGAALIAAIRSSEGPAAQRPHLTLPTRD